MRKLVLMATLAMLILTSRPLTLHTSSYSHEACGEVIDVVDGDTIDVKILKVHKERFSNYLGKVVRVRLADINAPELSTPEGERAKIALSLLLKDRGNRILLDIDDVCVVDRYNRLISLIYVNHNETHELNINMWLVANNHAEIKDFLDNEFDPGSWTLYVESARNSAPKLDEVADENSWIWDTIFYLVLAVLALLVLLTKSRKRVRSGSHNCGALGYA